ncbi:hypothetical protein [Cesiribacter sp. SM1]|uniref:hypothetical protein n=1 Tax=Cesiribacter sp. SM1 TaxID=2861196 RepID=UPI001CD43016|nr:hypothetical protein [Cesiribacter sp. SM1]
MPNHRIKQAPPALLGKGLLNYYFTTLNQPQRRRLLYSTDVGANQNRTFKLSADGKTNMKKDYILTLIFSLLTLIGFCQSAEPEIIVVSEYFYKDSKSYAIAAKLHNDRILIDNNFDIKSLVFNAKHSESANKYKAISSVNSRSLAELESIQSIIDSTYCDYLNPIYIIYSYQGETKKIVWNRITNCYPDKAKFIEEADEELSKLKDIYLPPRQ